MKKSIRIIAVVLAIVTLVSVMVMPVGATWVYPDGGSLYGEEGEKGKEKNKTVYVYHRDTNGTLLKYCEYKTDNGDYYVIGDSLYGYDVIGFSSNQGLGESCVLTWAAGNDAKAGYGQIGYQFFKIIGGKSLTCNLTYQKQEATTFNIKHYTVDQYGTKSLYASSSASYIYGNYMSIGQKSITGYTLAPGYASSISGTFTYDVLGATKNVDKYLSYRHHDGSRSGEMYDRKSYTYSSKDWISYCDNRKAEVTFLYNLNQYTIQFNANGGTNAPDSIVKYYGVNASLPTATPTRSDYTFLGWSTSSAATSPTYAAGSTYLGNSNKTLYAVWQKNAPTTYTVSYNANGGSGAPASQTKTKDITLTLSSVKPTRSGYTFMGWATTNTATTATYAAGSKYSVNSAVTFYAVWQKKAETYSVVFNANGGSGAPATQTKTENVSLTLSTIRPVRSGYTFKGWATTSTSASASYQPGDSYYANAPLTLYAVWEKNPEMYTVSYNANGGTNAPASQQKTENIALTLTTAVPTRPNYSFLGWSTLSSATAPDYVSGGTYSLNESSVLYAVWKKIPQTYTVSYHPNGGTNAPASQRKTEDVSLTLSENVPVRSGYNFLGWHIDSDADTPMYQPGDVYLTNATVTLYAVWEKINYEFSISNLTLSGSEIYRYGSTSVQVRVDSWDKINPYSDVPVTLLYDGNVVGTKTVSFTPYGLAYVTFLLNVGNTVGIHNLEARINWDNHAEETNPLNNSVSTMLTVKDYDYDVSVNNVLQNSPYYAGTTVITSFTVNNDSNYDILPSQNISAVFTAYYLEGSSKVVMSSQKWDQVVIPSGKTNLIYFKWSVPDSIVGKTVFCECTINADNTLSEANRANNTVTCENVIRAFSNTQPPNTQFEKTAPASYSPGATPPYEGTGSMTWNQWVYENGVFVLKTYGIKVSAAAPIVTPDPDCSTALIDSGNWKMKSGYGITLVYEPSVTFISGVSAPLQNAYTGVQKVIAAYPEYGFSTESEFGETLDSLNGAFVFKNNPDADGNKRIHFIPIYVADGKYNVSVTATQVWTPAGVISVVRNANGVWVEGSIYDDYYVGN